MVTTPKSSFRYKSLYIEVYYPLFAEDKSSILAVIISLNVHRNKGKYPNYLL